MVDCLSEDVRDIKRMCMELLQLVEDTEEKIECNEISSAAKRNLVKHLYSQYAKVNTEMRNVTIYYEELFRATGIVEDAKVIVDQFIENNKTRAVQDSYTEMREMEKDWENSEYISENYSCVMEELVRR